MSHVVDVKIMDGKSIISVESSFSMKNIHVLYKINAASLLEFSERLEKF